MRQYKVTSPKFSKIGIVFSSVGNTPPAPPIPASFSEETYPFWVPPLSEASLKSYAPLSESHPNWSM